MYEYKDDSGQTLVFGLNRNVTMFDFKFNPNGGKDGAEQECLDITFLVNNTPKSYRQFPVTQAFDDNGNTVTDPNHTAMKKAFDEFNQKITQLVKCFVTEEELKDALSKTRSFKEFCENLEAILPEGYDQIPLDVFASYSWNPKGSNSQKFLEIPSKVKHGKVFAPQQSGEFVEFLVKKDQNLAVYKGEEIELEEDNKKFICTIGDHEFSFSNRKGLMYIQETPEGIKVHPISRTDWFMESNFAKAANDEVADDETEGWD